MKDNHYHVQVRMHQLTHQTDLLFSDFILTMYLSDLFQLFADDHLHHYGDDLRNQLHLHLTSNHSFLQTFHMIHSIHYSHLLQFFDSLQPQYKLQLQFNKSLFPTISLSYCTSFRLLSSSLRLTISASYQITTTIKTSQTSTSQIQSSPGSHRTPCSTYYIHSDSYPY